MKYNITYSNMTIDDMLSTMILAVISLLFIGILYYVYIKADKKNPGLKGWIIGSGLQLIAVAMFLLREVMVQGTIKTIFTFVANMILLVSFSTILYSLLKMVGKRLNYWYSNIFISIFAILLFYATVITYDGNIIAITSLLSMLLSNGIALILINNKQTKEQFTRWFPYTVLTMISLSYILSMFVYLIIIKGESLSTLILYNGQNYLLKTTSLLIVAKSIGVLSALNTSAPSFYDMEDELFAGVFYKVPFMVMAIDEREHLIRYVNPYFSKEMGYNECDVIDKLELRDIHFDLEQFNRLRKEYYKEHSISSKEVTLKTKAGNILHGSLSISQMHFLEGTYIIASIINITEAVIAKNEYKNMALFDDLTKLPNRRPLMFNFDRKVKRDKRFSLMMIDLDNFKQINDTYGHSYGDEALKAVGEKLSIFNAETDIVSRYGGDEFVLIITNESIDETKKTIDKVLTIFKTPFTLKDKTIKIDASLGFACYPEDGKTLPNLIDKADRALYEAKLHHGDFANKFYDKE